MAEDRLGRRTSNSDTGKTVPGYFIYLHPCQGIHKVSNLPYTNCPCLFKRLVLIRISKLILVSPADHETINFS